MGQGLPATNILMSGCHHRRRRPIDREGVCVFVPFRIDRDYGRARTACSVTYCFGVRQVTINPFSTRISK